MGYVLSVGYCVLVFIMNAVFQEKKIEVYLAILNLDLEPLYLLSLSDCFSSLM